VATGWLMFAIGLASHG